MNMFEYCRQNGPVDMSENGIQCRDTHGHTFERVALPGVDLSTPELQVKALAALGERKIKCSENPKAIGEDGKPKGIGKVDIGAPPARVVALAWGVQRGVAAATEETVPEPAPSGKGNGRKGKGKPPTEETSATPVHAEETAPLNGAPVA